MTDDPKLHRDMGRAAKAQALLDNDLFKESFDSLERAYTDAWLATGNDDVKAREYYWQAVQVTRIVREHMKKIIANGKLAQAQIDKLAALEKTKNRKTTAR